MDLKEVKALFDCIDLPIVSKDDFMGAAQRAKGLKSINQDQQLLLYGLYKQGTIGDVNTPQPSAFSITDSLKWKNWKKFETLSMDMAMTAYVYVVDQLLAGKPLKPPAGSVKTGGSGKSTVSTKSEGTSISSVSQSFKTAPSAPASGKDEPCPFDSSVHLKTADPTPEQVQQIKQLRQMLSSFPLYKNHSQWADDTQLLRFLIARNFNIKDAFDLLKVAIKWRELRKPAEIESGPGWPHNMAKESETGKIYCPGNDRWGRSVLIFDNTVQNTNSIDDQMTFLAWNLEYAIKEMPPKVDKYLVFMHLNQFSFFNTPPMASTKETIHMLCNCFPERLGHCIAYQPPSVFRMFFNTVKGFLDAKTASKMVFIIGDVSDGSDNDKKMRELIGDNWKVLTGAEQPVVSKGCSPGYQHSKYWPQVLTNVERRKNATPSITTDATTTTTTTTTTAVDDSAVDSTESGKSSASAASGKKQRFADSTAADEEAEQDAAERRKNSRETYSRMKSFSEAVHLKKQILRGAAPGGGGKVLEVEESKGTAGGMRAIARLDDLNYLLSDLLYFLTIIGLAVFLFEWNKHSSGSSGGESTWA